MNIKKHIPNFLTCCNLLCGCIGIVEAFQGRLVNSSYLIFLACLFDFFDGFAARLLKVSSPIGKELDSLADVVTFGVLPGIIIFKLVQFAIMGVWAWPLPLTESIVVCQQNSFECLIFKYHFWLQSSGFIISVFSALRLAKFNIDTRQSDSFIGVPTPANAILIASLPLILASSETKFLEGIILNPYFLIALTLIMSFLLVAELPLFALKFKSFKWADNKIRYSFLISSVIIFVLLRWAVIPVIIFFYIILSVIDNKLLKSGKIQKS